MRCNKCDSVMYGTGDETFTHAGLYEMYKCEKCDNTINHIIMLYS